VLPVMNMQNQGVREEMPVELAEPRWDDWHKSIPRNLRLPALQSWALSAFSNGINGNVSHVLDFGAAIRVAPDDWRVGTSPLSSNLRASNRWATSRVCTIRVRTERDLPIPISSARRPPRHSFTRRFSLAFVNLCLYLFRSVDACTQISANRKNLLVSHVPQVFLPESTPVFRKSFVFSSQHELYSADLVAEKGMLICMALTGPERTTGMVTYLHKGEWILGSCQNDFCGSVLAVS
jgi:hypothetical protein